MAQCVAPQPRYGLADVPISPALAATHACLDGHGQWRAQIVDDVGHDWAVGLPIAETIGPVVESHRAWSGGSDVIHSGGVGVM